jgi:hypothetical protein
MNNKKISILCPTAKRPNEFNEMVSSAIKQSKKPGQLEFCLYLDQKDNSYDDLIKNFPPNTLKVIVGPKMWLSTMYNSLLTVATGDLLMWGGDDIVFVTADWDEKVIDCFSSFKDPLYMVFVNDLTYGAGTWANIGFVHKKWIELFGYLFTPHIPDNGFDAWITSITKKINRAYYLEDVIIEHRQYRQGKATIDSTYRQRLQKHKIYNPLFLYKSLDEEKRRDLLQLAMTVEHKSVPFDFKFSFATFSLKLFEFLMPNRISNETKIYVGSMNNFNFIKLILRKIGLQVGPRNWY